MYPKNSNRPMILGVVAQKNVFTDPWCSHLSNSPRCKETIRPRQESQKSRKQRRKWKESPSALPNGHQVSGKNVMNLSLMCVFLCVFGVIPLICTKAINFVPRNANPGCYFCWIKIRSSAHMRWKISVPKNHWNPPIILDGFGSVLPKVLGSPNHRWLEIPWFLGVKRHRAGNQTKKSPIVGGHLVANLWVWVTF